MSKEKEDAGLTKQNPSPSSSGLPRKYPDKLTEYFYDDIDIVQYVDMVVKSELKGFESSSFGRRIFLQERLQERQNLYKVAIAPPIDSSQNRAPVKNSLSPILPSIIDSDLPLKILFPYSTGYGSHWLTGEIIINQPNSENKYDVNICVHDPFGGGVIDRNIKESIKSSFEDNFSDDRGSQVKIRAKDMNFNYYKSPYKVKRQNDGTSCGLIVSREIIKRAKGEDLNLTYTSGCKEQRQLDLDKGIVTEKQIEDASQREKDDMASMASMRLHHLYLLKDSAERAKAIVSCYPDLDLKPFLKDRGQNDGAYLNQVKEGIAKTEIYDYFFDRDGKFMLDDMMLLDVLGGIYSAQEEEKKLLQQPISSSTSSGSKETAPDKIPATHKPASAASKPATNPFSSKKVLEFLSDKARLIIGKEYTSGKEYTKLIEGLAKELNKEEKEDFRAKVRGLLEARKKAEEEERKKTEKSKAEAAAEKSAVTSTGSANLLPAEPSNKPLVSGEQLPSSSPAMIRRDDIADREALLKGLNELNKDPFKSKPDHHLVEKFEQIKSGINSKIEPFTERVGGVRKEFLEPPRYSGIGVKAKYEYIDEEKSWKFTVEEVFKDSPAEKRGIKIPTEWIFKATNNDTSLAAIASFIRSGEFSPGKTTTPIKSAVFEISENGYKLSNITDNDVVEYLGEKSIDELKKINPNTVGKGGSSR